MKMCKHYQSMMIEVLYEEVNSAEMEQFEAHLRECPACAREYEQLQSMLGIMHQRRQPELDASYWERYWERLSSRLEQKITSHSFLENLREKVASLFPEIPGWGYRVAAAAALLTAGIFIGRILFTPSVPMQTREESSRIPVQYATVRQEVDQYLEKSKLVLMGLMNTDPQQEAEFMENFSLQQEISQNLVQQSGALKKKLDSPAHQRLKELISELEMILRQIANLDKQFDLDEIQIIKLGVKHKFLLFKIHIEEMKASGPDSTAVQEEEEQLIL